MKFRTSVGAVLLVLTLMLGGCQKPHDGDHVTLSFADGFSASHPVNLAAVTPFLEHLRKFGPEVGLDVKYFSAGSLGNAEEMLPQIRTGSVDIGQVVPANQSNEIPLSTVGDLPGVTDDPCAAVDTVLGMMQEGEVLYEEELEPHRVLPLFAVPIPDYEVVTAGRAVAEPDDLAGVLMRSPGGIGDRTLKQLGAAPVALPAPDTYEGLSRGTIDGTMMAPTTILSYSLQEVIDNTTSGLNLLNLTSAFGINTEVWSDLDTDQKQVIKDAANLVRESGCKQMLEASKEAEAQIASSGTRVTEVSPEERQDWVDALGPVRQQWVDELEQRGKPAREVLETFERRLKENQR